MGYMGTGMATARSRIRLGETWEVSNVRRDKIFLLTYKNVYAGCKVINSSLEIFF